MDVTVGGAVQILEGEDLNLEILRLRNDIQTIDLSRMQKVFTSFEGLDIPQAGVTLLTIIERLPLHSALIVEVYGGSHGKSLPTPYVTGGSIQNNMSGQLIAVKSTEHGKVQFYWRNENYTAECSYNAAGGDPKLKPWRFVQTGIMGTASGMAPSQFENKMSNIWVQGNYYWTRGQMVSFTDRPTDNGGWLKVFGDKTWGLCYEFVQNGSLGQTWKRTNDSPWVYVPMLCPVGTSDAAMAVGDMRPDGTGRLLVKTSANRILNLDLVQATTQPPTV